MPARSGSRPNRNDPATVAALLALATVAGSSPAADVFELSGRRPDRIVISTRSDLDRHMTTETVMGRTVNGVLADLGKGRIGRLRRCVLERVDVPDGATAFATVGYAHLFADDVHEVLELAAADDHLVVMVRELDTAEPRAVLDRQAFEQVIEDAPSYRGSFEPDGGAAGGGRIELVPPDVASAITMDRHTMKQRLYRGMNVVNDGTDRELDRERMHLRLPRAYDPRRPAGLLVWASPTPGGRVPRLFDASLDELNLVCIGVDDAGNDRDVQDKLQLMLDAVATASRRCHVDPRRVYIAGLSGGGKVSSLLTLCFPDVFAGAVPIVGLASHHELDAGWQQHRYRYFSPPRGELLRLARTRPLAVVTGPHDFNYEEMKLRTRLLQDAGFGSVRFFEDPDMAHTMPTAVMWRAALRHIDEPWQRQRAAEVDQARTQLDAYRAGRGETRADLVRIIETAPFSEPAWQAWELLSIRESVDGHVEGAAD